MPSRCVTREAGPLGHWRARASSAGGLARSPARPPLAVFSSCALTAPSAAGKTRQPTGCSAVRLWEDGAPVPSPHLVARGPQPREPLGRQNRAGGAAVGTAGDGG